MDKDLKDFLIEQFAHGLDLAQYVPIAPMKDRNKVHAAVRVMLENAFAYGFASGTTHQIIILPNCKKIDDDNTPQTTKELFDQINKDTTMYVYKLYVDRQSEHIHTFAKECRKDKGKNQDHQDSDKDQDSTSNNVPPMPM